MIKTYAKGAVIALCMGITQIVFSQTGNISMNLAGAASTNPAILDLSDASNAHLGFLLPNVSLASSTDILTIPGPTAGMIVWNTNSGMPFGIGFYYWDGSNWDVIYNSGSAVAGAPLSPSTGLTGSIYNGSAAVSDWAVAYGSTAGTAVQGNNTITITAGTGLSGGGTITEGAGGTITLNNTGALPSLSNDFIWTGNASSAATAVQMSGDATMANTGAVKVKALESATTSVSVSTAAAPTNGQVLTASSGTQAAWATPSTVATSVPFSGITNGTNNSATMTVTTGGTLTYSLNGNINATGIETFIGSTNSPAFPIFVANNNNGGFPQVLATNAAYTYNPGTQTLSATNFIGASATLGKASQAGVLVVGDAEATPKTATIQAPATITATYTINLPTAAAGSTGMVLGVPTATGQLGWITPNAGTVTGSGTATQVAFWSGASSLGGNSNLYWDNTNSRLGIGTNTPAEALDVNNSYIHINGTASPTVTVQGSYISWNDLTGGAGEMDLINNQGGGSGGFAFINTASTWAARATLMQITGPGAVIIPALATAGAVHYSTGTGQIALVAPNSTATLQYLSQTSSGTPVWITPSAGLTAANNGVSVSGGTTVQLGDPAAGPYPSVLTGSRWVTQNGSSFVHDFSNGTATQNTSTTVNWSIQNGGASDPYVYVMNNTSTNQGPVPGPLVGIGLSNPAVALDVAQNNAIRVGGTYISSGTWAGSAGFADFASNAWFDGSVWHFPNTANSNNSGAFQFANDAFTVYQTTTPFNAATFTQRLDIAPFTASNNFQGNVTIGTTARSANILNVGVTTANPTTTGFGILMTAQQGAATFAGGAVSINAGAGNTTGAGGAASISAGAAGTTAAGGNITIAATSGGATGTGAAGTVSIAAGNGGGATSSAGSAGGNVTITAGNAKGTGNNNGGNITLGLGTATGTGTPGVILIPNPANTFNYSIKPQAISAARNLYLPKATANDTLAIIPSATQIIQNSFATAEATNSAAGRFYGLGANGATITPTETGRIMVMISGDYTESTLNRPLTLQIVYGSGTAPAADALLTSVTFTAMPAKIVPNDAVDAGSTLAFSLQGIITGLPLGVTYWIDISFTRTGNANSQINEASVSGYEF